MWLKSMNSYSTSAALRAYRSFLSRGSSYIQKYFTDSDDWQHNGKNETLYTGYPWMTPCNPIRGDMVWYVNEKLGIGI